VTSDELPLFIAPSAFLPFFFFCFQFHALESLRSTTIVYKYIPTCCWKLCFTICLMNRPIHVLFVCVVGVGEKN
jgi:hypothetical protein